MTSNGWLQVAVFFALVLLAAKPMGLYMAQVYERKKTWLDPVLGPVERVLYRLTGVDPEAEMRWTEYGLAMLIFSLATLLLTYLVERLQHAIPLWNPQHLAAVEPYLAWNTAVLVYDEYELAVVCAGADDELPDPDVRVGHAQLLVGGDGYGRWRSRLSAASRGASRRRWATSGWTLRAARYGCWRRCAWCMRWRWCRRA